MERSVSRQERLLTQHFHQQTQKLNSLEIKVQQLFRQMRNMPKELGYPWETGQSEDQLKIDDGLGAKYLLPVEFCRTPEVIFPLLSGPLTWYKTHALQKILG